MNSSQLAWHQAKKDIRHRSPLLWLWIAILLAYLLASWWLMTSAFESALSLQHASERLAQLRFATFVLPALIIPTIVNDDTPYGSSAASLTRPLGWFALAGSKLFITGLLFVLLPSVVDCVLAALCGERSRLLLVLASAVSERGIASAIILTLSVASRSFFVTMGGALIAIFLGFLIGYLIWGNYMRAIIMTNWGALHGTSIIIASYVVLSLAAMSIVFAYRRRHSGILLALVIGAFAILPLSHAALVSVNQSKEGPALPLMREEPLLNRGARGFFGTVLEPVVSASVFPPDPTGDILWSNGTVDAFPSLESSKVIGHYEDIDISDEKIYFPSFSNVIAKMASRAGEAPLRVREKRSIGGNRPYSESLFTVHDESLFGSETVVSAEVEAFVVGFTHTLVGEIPLKSGAEWRKDGERVKLGRITLYRGGQFNIEFNLQSFSILADRRQSYLGMVGEYDFAMVNRSSGDFVLLSEVYDRRQDQVLFSPEVSRFEASVPLDERLSELKEEELEGWIRNTSLLIIRREFAKSYTARQDATFTFSDTP